MDENSNWSWCVLVGVNYINASSAAAGEQRSALVKDSVSQSKFNGVFDEMNNIFLG